MYIPGLRRSDRFLRRTAPPFLKELCPFFFLIFFIHKRLVKLLPMSSLKPSFLPKPLSTIIVFVKLLNRHSYINIKYNFRSSMPECSYLVYFPFFLLF